MVIAHFIQPLSSEDIGEVTDDYTLLTDESGMVTGFIIEKAEEDVPYLHPSQISSILVVSNPKVEE